jgi:molecular chaperone HscA
MNLVNINEPDKKKSSNIPCLGIDFGTTNSVCSVKINEKIIYIEDSKKKLIPSIVFFENQKVFIGNQIENKSISEIIFSVKRFFTDNPDKIIFDKGSNKKTAIDISKEIFSYIKNISQDYLKQNIDDCVLTVPAYFDEKARSGIMRAAFLAGFNVRRLINEPTAAAFAYGLEKKKRGLFLVYDLGGGTFDVSLLELKKGVFRVLGSGGDAKLGGDDLDILFTKSILKKFFSVNLNEVNDDLKVKIIKKCQSIKENLLNKKSVLESIKMGGEEKKINIELNLLNQSIEKLIDKTITIVENLLNECKVNISSVDGFILVGGSTRLEIIKNKLVKKFNIKIFSELDPDLVVSCGAAMHGYELLNGSKNLLLDVTPLSLGIETMGGLMEKIIPRNSPIPAIREQIFTTNENGQTSIKIKILQGEREVTSANNMLDEFVLSGLEPKPAGIPRIKVRFSLDVDGILFVSAIDESSGKENNLVVKTNDQLSIHEMRELVSSSIQNAKKDIDLRLLIETKIKATKLINEINNVKPMMNELCTSEESKEINKIIKLMKIELKSDNKNKISNLIDDLNNKTKNFAQKIIDSNFSNFVGKEIDVLDKS